MSTLCCAKRECLPTVAVLSSVAAAAKEDAAKAGQGMRRKVSVVPIPLTIIPLTILFP